MGVSPNSSPRPQHETLSQRREPHVKARTERPEEYPERSPVSDTLVNWRTPFPYYAPPRYESPRMLSRSPDPTDIHTLTRTMHTYEPRGIRIDGASGEPLNPRGRTGLSGRGQLYLWGPNHAADFLLTRFNTDTNKLEALLILRKNGQWAIPGGMVDAGESPAAAAMRELKEETNIPYSTSTKTWELYRGYVDDYRNTDNAWMETVVLHEHLGNVTPRDWQAPTGGDDARKAEWRPLTTELMNGLFASHPSFVRAGLEVLTEAPGTDPHVRSAAAALLSL